MLVRQPRINELEALIAKVPSYPLSARHMVALALRQHASPAAIEFYSAFPDDTLFRDEEELLARSEQVAIMDMNLQEQPREILVAAEED